MEDNVQELQSKIMTWRLKIKDKMDRELEELHSSKKEGILTDSVDIEEFISNYDRVMEHLKEFDEHFNITKQRYGATE